MYTLFVRCVLGGGGGGGTTRFFVNDQDYPAMLKYSPDFPTAVVSAVMS